MDTTLWPGNKMVVDFDGNNPSQTLLAVEVENIFLGCRIGLIQVS